VGLLGTALGYCAGPFVLTAVARP